MGMLAFVLYLLLLLYGFAERRLWRLWLLFGFGGAILYGAAWFLRNPALFGPDAV